MAWIVRVAAEKMRCIVMKIFQNAKVLNNANISGDTQIFGNVVLNIKFNANNSKIYPSLINNSRKKQSIILNKH